MQTLWVRMAAQNEEPEILPLVQTLLNPETQGEKEGG